MVLPLACPVRGCLEPICRHERTFVCPKGHTFDIARAGYVNLLQPQDRKSPEPGDSREAVEARASLLARGIGSDVIDAVVAWAAAMPSTETPTVVDLGCGSGEALGRLAAIRSIQGIGIDLANAAAAHAARRFPEITWIVANADRKLPLLDCSVDLVLSIHARRNPSECRRVLRESGRLLVAIPAADDLIELRETVQGAGVERDRVEALVAEHEPLFAVVQRATSRQQLTLGREGLLQLLRGTYRGKRLSQSSRVQTLDALTVTLASELVVFEPS